MISRLIAVVRAAAASPTSPLYLAAGALLTASGLTMLTRYQRAQLEAITATSAQLQDVTAVLHARRVDLEQLRQERIARVDQVLEDVDS